MQPGSVRDGYTRCMKDDAVGLGVWKSAYQHEKYRAILVRPHFKQCAGISVTLPGVLARRAMRATNCF